MWAVGACIPSHTVEGGHFSAGSLGFDPRMAESIQTQAGTAGSLITHHLCFLETPLLLTEERLNNRIRCYLSSNVFPDRIERMHTPLHLSYPIYKLKQLFDS